MAIRTGAMFGCSAADYVTDDPNDAHFDYEGHNSELVEKLYLVCECGEAFDSLETAMKHRIEQGQSPEFRIMTESEAM